jgi:hypothetical protein
MDQDVCYRYVTFRYAEYNSTIFFPFLELLMTPNKHKNNNIPECPQEMK